MIIDCISDLHGFYPTLEGGDLLIVAGDLTKTGESWEMRQNFMPWIIKQNYSRKIFISGNHDKDLFEQMPTDCPIENINYLCDSGTEFVYEENLVDECTINGKRHSQRIETKLKIWGSPWTKTFEGMNSNCKAFTVDTEQELAEKWALIPDDIDILVTHSPPWGVMDLPLGSRQRAGSTTLLSRLNEGKISPKVHCFGHIHEEYGVSDLKMVLRTSPKMKLKAIECKFINASHVNERYEPVNKPIRVIL